MLVCQVDGSCGNGDATFGGTSSASPRISGYVADPLLRIRRHYGYAGGITDGALVVVAPQQRPSQGPLADGALTAAELHEVVRKTANPHAHPSMYDGRRSGVCIPDPSVTPFSVYVNAGYGEVSEHTIEDALAVALGEAPMPSRPVEDAMFAASEALRGAAWE